MNTRIFFHYGAVFEVKADAGRKEILETIGVAIMMGGGARCPTVTNSRHLVPSLPPSALSAHQSSERAMIPGLGPGQSSERAMIPGLGPGAALAG